MLAPKRCDGKRQEDTGAYYCPEHPEDDDWDCDDCPEKPSYDFALDRAIDAAEEKDWNRWGE
jgi:hypothetical protein